MPTKKTTSKSTTKNHRKTQESTDTPQVATFSRKLYRSESDRMVAGVAGGLGEYFNLDPTIFRLLFVLMTLFGGSGVLAYIILWLVIPAKSNKNVPSEESIKENANEMKEKAEQFAQDFSVKGKQDSRYLLGLMLLVLGVLFIFNNFGFFHFMRFDKLWPLLLVVLGLAILTRKS